MDRRARYARITTATTTVVKAAPGTLWSVVVNKPVGSSTITIYDNTAGSGTVIALITNSADTKPFDLGYGVRFETGLTIVTSGADDVTVVYG